MKLKRIMASILCLAMVLSTMGTVAFANNTEADVWDGTVDTSWYNDTDTEFTITTAEQFAGLAYLVNGAQSFNPALDNYTTADFGYYSEGRKSATPDETAADNSISFEGKTIYLAADLDLCPVDANGELVKLPGNEQLSMMPVGYSSYTPFKGTFDGQGHTIKNLFQGGWDMYGTGYNNSVKLGLFGNVEDATIMNLVIDNFGFNAEITLGGVVGIANGSTTLDSITIKNSTIATGGGWTVGGVVGYVYGNPVINGINIDETNTIAQVGGHYDVSVGGIIGRCDDEGCESVTITDSNVACKLDVYNDCTANYNTNSYRNCGMVIGGVGESNEITIDGKLYPDFDAKNFTFENVNVTIGEWANYTYCWSYDLPKNCQRIEPGVGYKGVDVSTVTDPSIDTSRPFDAIFGAENAGNLSNVRGDVDVRVMEFLGIEGVNVVDEAHLALFAAEVYKYSDITRAATLIYVDSFATLQDAIDSIGSDEGEYEIRVIKDIEEDVTVTQYANQKITIVGDEANKPVISGTITVNGRSNAEEGEALTLKNLAFNADAVASNAIVFVPAAGQRYAMNITIDGCDVVGTTDNSFENVALFKESTGGGKNLVIKNTTIKGIHSLAQVKNINGITIDNCEIDDCKNGINLNNSPAATITNTTADIAGYAVRIGQSDNTNTDALNYAMLVTLEGNTFTSSSNEDALIIARGGAQTADFDIKSGTYTNTAGMDVIALIEGSDAAISGGLYSSNVDTYLVDGYELTRTANGYLVIEDETSDDEGRVQADSISVEYKDITAADAEGEKVYEVVVKANDGDMINELASVDLTFVYTSAPVTGGNIDFTVAPADKFAMTRYENTNRYMFNYNGVDAFEGTANEITVATIKVVGYGEFTIATDDTVDTNIVNATTLYDNLVDSYTVAGATDDDTTTGALDISGKIDNGNIAVPTRTLTINIDFPNAVVDNAIAYQDMKVEITGTIDGVNKTVVYNLGEDEVAMTNGDYVVVEDALVLNNAYTVTVSGAGYRTARYTVTMTDDKQLNFWNNVMDEAQVVEVGKDSSIAKVTFLAGDIVKDNNINIYDLSAVVSYFGTETNTAAYDAYAKYDLNRDGVIDSKDVAYVLVSWNN